MSKFYAVKVGRVPGIYLKWSECKEQVERFSGAVYKSFSSRIDAENFLRGVVITAQAKGLETDKLIVYTDGACPNTGNASTAGIGVHFPDGSYPDLSEPLPEPPYSNNRAEIYAVIRALQVTEGPIIIYTDSTQVIKTMTEWLLKRLAANWKCLNSDLYKQLYALSKDRDVEYCHVPGHSGVIGNEIADQLAVAGCNRY